MGDDLDDRPRTNLTKRGSYHEVKRVRGIERTFEIRTNPSSNQKQLTQYKAMGLVFRQAISFMSKFQ